MTWTDAEGVAGAIEADTGLVVVETPAHAAVVAEARRAGLDTIKLADDPRADLAAIRAAGHPTVTPVIVMNDPGARVELV